MAILPILTIPDPRLKKTAAPVAQVDDEVRRLMDDMLTTMYQAPGIGLAAPQVGVLRRVLVVDVAERDQAPAPLPMANPEILWQSDHGAVYEEGCLSVPDQYAEVERPAEVVIRYLDRDNIAQELRADGLLATCLQHEIDHLEGQLFIDHLSALKRKMIIKRVQKLQRKSA